MEYDDDYIDPICNTNIQMISCIHFQPIALILQYL